MRRSLLTLFVFLGLMTGFSSNAYSETTPQIVTAEDPELITKILDKYGSAKLSTDGDGDPKITGQLRGRRYTLFFYGCEENKNCKSIQFSTYWTAYKNISAESVANWSWDQGAFAKAQLDEENDPFCGRLSGYTVFMLSQIIREENGYVAAAFSGCGNSGGAPAFLSNKKACAIAQASDP